MTPEEVTVRAAEYRRRRLERHRERYLRLKIAGMTSAEASVACHWSEERITEELKQRGLGSNQFSNGVSPTGKIRREGPELQNRLVRGAGASK